MMNDTAIVLFRCDLRLSDQPALSAACANHTRVLPVYVHSPLEEAPWSPGAASRWWLHHSLRALQDRLAAQGAQMHVVAGDTLGTLRALISQTSASALYWSRCYEPAAIARDTALKTALRAESVAVHSLPGNLWREPWQVATEQRQPYRVFTPFWRNARAVMSVEPPLPEARARKWLHLPGKPAIASAGAVATCPLGRRTGRKLATR